MKRVCVVTNMHNAFDTRVFKKESVSLTKEYEVYLVAPNVNSQIKDGVHIEGVTLPTSRIKRLLSVNRLYPILKRIDADVYHFHDPGLMGLGLRIKKIGKRIIYDSHEDAPETIKNKEWLPKILRMPLYYLVRYYEKVALKKYDALISVTPSIVERLKTINPNTFQITNYPSLKPFVDNRKWGNAICYTGGISAYWMIHNIVDAVNQTNVRLILAGTEPEPDYIKTLKEKEGWSNVDYRGKIPYEKIEELLQESSAACAIHSFKDPNVGYTIGTLGNTKFFECMMVGVPLITSSHVLWKEIVDKYKCGLYVNPDRPEEIRKAILFIVNNPKEARIMGDNGRAAAEKEYNWETQEKVLFQVYRYVLKK